MKRAIDPEEILKLREEGLTYGEIARRLGIPSQMAAVAVREMRKGCQREMKKNGQKVL